MAVLKLLLHLAEPDVEGFQLCGKWGTEETAAKDAIIVFYQIQRDDRGKIIKIDFNFVGKSEFDKTYQIVSR